MTTITDFIKARLDEDEATCRFATLGPWRPEEWPIDHGREFLVVSDLEVGAPAFAIKSERDAQHIARHDPASVLRRVAAIRAALAEIDREEEALMHNSANPFDGLGMRACDEKRGFRLAKSILLDGIATFWATHPDYRPGWNSFGAAT